MVKKLVFSTSALSSVASLTQIIQQKVDVIQQEHKEFVKQVKEESIEPNTGTAVPPWEGLPNEDELKEQMLTLSKDKRNFLINPPENTNFQFDMNIYYQTATAVLHADPNLDRMRFELVPSQVQEPTFWRNYFYRISLIKQTALGSIDGVALENEVYSKNQEESAEETGATNTVASTEIETEGKENNKDEESKEVLFDVEKSGDNSGAWMENKIAEVASEGAQGEEEGDEEIMDDWEEQMKKELEDQG